MWFKRKDKAYKDRKKVLDQTIEILTILEITISSLENRIDKLKYIINKRN